MTPAGGGSVSVHQAISTAPCHLLKGGSLADPHDEPSAEFRAAEAAAHLRHSPF